MASSYLCHTVTCVHELVQGFWDAQPDSSFESKKDAGNTTEPQQHPEIQHKHAVMIQCTRHASMKE